MTEKRHEMRTHVRPYLLAAAGLIAAVGAPVHAQDPGPELQSFRTPGWSFTPGITFGTVYDSNVALANAPADTHRTQSDRLYEVQPFGRLEYFSPRTEFSTGYQGYLRRYAEVDQLNGFDQQAFGSVRRLITRRLTFFAHDSFGHLPTTDDVELNGVPFRRIGSRTNGGEAGIEARLTKYTDLSVRYENTWIRFDRPELFLTDGWVNGVHAELSRRLSERLSAGAEYGFRLADLNEGTHQVQFQDVGGTLHYHVGSATTLSLAGGVSHLDDRLVLVTRTGPYVRANVTHEVKRATVGASFERSYVPSFSFGGSTQSQEIRGFVRMPLDKNRLYVQGSAAWRRNDPFIANELQLDTIWIRSTLGYSATRWFRIEGFHAFTRQDSIVTGGEINRHRLGVQAVVSQPMRIQ
jgi:hypothetical protein